MGLSRRHFMHIAGTSLLLQSQLPKFLKAQSAAGAVPDASQATSGPSKVALIHGEDRRKNVYQALLAIDDQIKPALARKKYVLIKPNNVSTERQLAATNVDALNGILDYLEPRFRGPVMIAESSTGDTLEGFANFKYDKLPTERRSQKISLVDLNREGRYELSPIVNPDLHVTPLRLAARMFDPDAFIISSAMLKTHNFVVATMSVKNMAMGAPLRSAPGQGQWSDKPKVHPNFREANFNMLLNAQKLRPYWGLAVIDGFEGMEGNGPIGGTPVASRVAIASTDLVAADRVGLEVMGINPDWVGYLNFASQMGLGQFDLNKIQLVGGTAIASVQKKYKLSDMIDRELHWMGPIPGGSQNMSSLPDLRDYSIG